MEERNADKGVNEPTNKQIAAISRLARLTKSSVDMNKVSTKQQASELIEELIAKRSGAKGTAKGSNGNDSKCAYGMATKLVFSKYLEFEMDYRKVESFWDEVDEFYRTYVKRMSQAI